jgi:hypothetical protein
MTRLTPLADTIRKLYLYSGNECAFPGCPARLFNDEGVYIAELAHIEAAEEGGPRYNEDQDDEDRRKYENLLFLCHEHHKVTDGDEYTVQVMQGMKRNHEMKFGENAVRKMRLALQDLTEGDTPTGRFSLARLDSLDGYGFGAGSEELQGVAEDLREFARRLSDVPLEHRSILRILLKRGQNAGFQQEVIEITVHELLSRIGMDWDELAPRVDLLQRHGLAELERNDESEYPPVIQTKKQYLREQLPNGRTEFREMYVWSLLRDFCLKTDGTFEEIFDNLNFGVLD